MADHIASRRRPRPAAGCRLIALTVVLTVFAAAGCSAVGGTRGPAAGADVERPAEPSMSTVRLVDVAEEVGLDFRHSAFQWGTTGDPNAMMGGGLCWIDVDRDGWLDLFVVDTWSEGEWGRWRAEGALPTSRLYRNDRGRFVDVTDEVGAGLETRGSGCVAADLDLDGFTDLYVTTERENVLLWNDGGRRFEPDDGSAGVNAYGWHAGAAVGDVNGDGLPDLFVAGYADLNRPIPEATRGFPNPFVAEPDLLFVNQGRQDSDGRPRFVDLAARAGIEADRVDYGLGAVLTDVDDDGDLDLYVANDTQPNRLYLNESVAGDPGFRFVDIGADAGVDDDNAGMGVAIGDSDASGGADIAVTNMAGQGHAVFRRDDGSRPVFRSALEEMGLPDLGQDRTGWGIEWADLDLDADLDLIVAQGAIPVTDLEADREVTQVFENRTSDGGFVEVTSAVGLDRDGRFLGRGLAAADYDNDGDVDFAVGTIGGSLGLLRNVGAGGHWLVVSPEPATPGTIVSITMADRSRQRREILAGSSYLSSADPRAHFGLGELDQVAEVIVRWPDGREAVLTEVVADQILEVDVQSD